MLRDVFGEINKFSFVNKAKLFLFRPLWLKKHVTLKKN